MKFLIALLLALSPAEGLAAPGDEATIVTAERGTRPASRLGITTSNDRLVLQYRDPTGIHGIPCEDVVEIRIADARPPSSSFFRIELTSGDRLIGKPDEGSESALKLRTEPLGEVSVHFDRIRSILSIANAADPPHGQTHT